MTEPVRALHPKSCSTHSLGLSHRGIAMASQKKKKVVAFSLLKQGFSEQISETSQTKAVQADHWVSLSPGHALGFSLSTAIMNSPAANSKCSVLRQRSPDKAQPCEGTAGVPGNAKLKWRLNTTIANSCLQFSPFLHCFLSTSASSSPASIPSDSLVP